MLSEDILKAKQRFFGARNAHPTRLKIRNETWAELRAETSSLRLITLSNRINYFCGMVVEVDDSIDKPFLLVDPYTIWSGDD